MEAVNVQREVFEEVSLLGKKGLFTEMRVDQETVPEGVYCYELRHGDDEGFPVSVEESVRVNYFGAVLLSEPLELGEEKSLQLGYEGFSYTGGQMYLSQAVGGQEPEEFRDGEALAEFVKEAFPMTAQEGQVLIGYMEGHGYVVGQKGGQLYRGDFCIEAERVVWEETTLDDLVDSVCEWNYELLQDAKAELENSDNITDFVKKRSRYEDLCADERVLDGMFERTKYQKELDGLAVKLADQFIRDINEKGGIDAAIKKMTDQLKAGEDLLPDVSSALKKNGGKTR